MSLAKAVVKAFETIAPRSLAGSWDNVGLLLEGAAPSAEQRRVVLTVDLTPAVVDALPKDTGVIVSYHPPIFRGLKALTLQDPLQASLLRCAARSISVYSPHTCLDAANEGIDFWLASAFSSYGIREMMRIKPASSPPSTHDQAGSGMIVKLEQSISLNEAIAAIKKHLKMSTIQVARAKDQDSISSIALCAGSGGSVLSGADADLYWTGEMGHHEILAAVNSGHNVVLCNHSNTERGFLADRLQPRLQALLDEQEGSGYTMSVSEADRDPLDFV